MAGLQNYVDGNGLERKLLDLVRIRALQINGCAYCIVMHTNDARKHGENDECMHLLNAWREAPISARERAALAWTEAASSTARPARLQSSSSQSRNAALLKSS